VVGKVFDLHFFCRGNSILFHHLILAQKIVGLHLFTREWELAGFRNFVPRLVSRVIMGVKYGNLVERDHGPPAEGPARFHTTRWTIVMRAALSQMQLRRSALAGLCRLYRYPRDIFGRRRGHSPSEINEEIQAFCEALIATGGRLGP
jgi:hypothetical protein